MEPVENVERLRPTLPEWEGTRIETGNLIALDESTVLMEGRQLATGRASRLELSESQHIVFRFDGGRVVEMYWHPHREGALQAAGLSE